jgi:predicted transcriptional regulator
MKDPNSQNNKQSNQTNKVDGSNCENKKLVLARTASIEREIVKFIDTNPVNEAAIEMNKIGFKIVPLNPSDNSEYQIPQNRYYDFLVEDIPSIFTGQNLGIYLGSLSKNLFTITCYSEQEYETLCFDLKNYIKWVTIGRGSYTIWLLCKEGEIRNNEYLSFSINGEDIQLAPPSISLRGDYCAWYAKEGDLPPSISILKLRKTFPLIEDYLHTPAKLYSPGINRPIRSLICRRLINWSNNFHWQGRTAITDKHVFIACIRLADLERPKDFRATIRHVAQEANVSKQTVQRSLQRLCNSRMIKRIKNDDLDDEPNNPAHKYKKANRYAIDKPMKYISDEEFPFDKYASRLPSYQNHEAFSRGGLGLSGAILLDTLQRNPQSTISGIARTTGLSRNTVKKVKNKLLDADLITQEDGLWKAKYDLANRLDIYAEGNDNVRGAYQKKIATFRKERARYLAKVTIEEIARSRRL